MENQSIPIHRAANRPILLLGCDRELIGFVMIAAFALIWIGQSWVAVGYGLFLFCFSLFGLRLAAKADPLMRQVYMRSRLYKRTYLARSTPFVDMKVKRGSLKRYRSPAPGFSDLLNWAAVVDDGVILNKDGSLTAGWIYEGEDEASRTDEEKALVAYRINEALKRLDGGWMLHVSATRREAAGYSRRGLSHFPDPVTAAIDEERRRKFTAAGTLYQSRFWLIVTWHPPFLAQKKFTDMMFEDTSIGQDAHRQTLSIIAQFKNEVAALENRLSPPFRMRRLRGVSIPQEDGSTVIHDELLSHLQFCSSGDLQPIQLPREPIYIDAYLGGKDMITGVIPRIGNKFLQVVTIEGFPDNSSPGILTALAELSIEYRWTTRFVFLERQDALNLLNAFRKKWRQKMRGLLSQIFYNPAAPVNHDAKQMGEDAEEALTEIQSGDTTGGYYSSTVVLFHEDRTQLERAAKQVEKTINHLGFVARIESLNTVDAFMGSLPGHGTQNLRRPFINVYNLAHLLPTSTIWTGSNKAPSPMYPPLAPALAQCITKGNTPFWFNVHVADVGHTMMFGPTGAGKSTHLAFIVAQLFRYPGMSVFCFDKGMSLYPLCKAAGGQHYTVASDSDKLSFCPLQFLETRSDKAWALEWIETILGLNDKRVSPEERNEIAKAIENMGSTHGNSLTHFLSSVQIQEVQAALKQYTIEGTMGHLLDAEEDSLHLSRFTVFEIEELMRLGEKYALPVLLYLFRRIERLIQAQGGRPSAIFLDEAWLMLGHPVFRDKIYEWLKVLRKLNCFVFMATQSLSDAARSGILDVIAESTATKIYLPNPYAREESFSDLYINLGLNRRQINIIAEATPKKEYYMVTAKGRRLYELDLGPLALAFCASSDKETLVEIQQLEARYREDWVTHYLARKQLSLKDYKAAS